MSALTLIAELKSEVRLSIIDCLDLWDFAFTALALETKGKAIIILWATGNNSQQNSFSWFGCSNTSLTIIPFYTTYFVPVNTFLCL